MKKLIILLVASASVLAGFAQKQKNENKVIIGTLSPDTENENGEKDPPFALKLRPLEAEDLLPSANQGFMKDLSQPMVIALQTAYAFMEKEIRFDLLPQHKYMLDECTGLKACNGQISFHLPAPEVKVTNNGLYIRYSLDKVRLNALNVRTSPCTEDTKCHFSKAFTTEGTISNLVLEIVANPVVDLQNCKLVGLGAARFNWKIGDASLHQLQPNMNTPARNMIEDAMNVNSALILSSRLQEAMNGSLAKNPDCGKRKLPASDLAYAITIDDIEAWEIVNPPVKESKPKLLGKTSVNSRSQIVVYAGDQKVISSNHFPIALSPGIYRIKLNNIPIDDVEIRKGKNTRIRLAHIVFTNNSWSIYDESGVRLYLSGEEKSKVAIPVGTYQIRSGHQRMQKVVKEDETFEF